MRPINVLLHDVALGRALVIWIQNRICCFVIHEFIDLLNVACQENSFALTEIVGFDNEGDFVFLAIVLIMCEMIP